MDKRYSIVFAVADQTEYQDALFKKGSVIKADTGIVDCYLGGYDSNPATGDNAKVIGCDDKGKNPDGLIFGKVIDGGKDDDLLNWRGIVRLGSGAELKRFPMTVRLVPTDKLTNDDFCARLY